MKIEPLPCRRCPARRSLPRLVPPPKVGTLAVRAAIVTLPLESAGRGTRGLQPRFHRQQVERRTEGAPTKAARQAHEELARKHAEQMSAIALNPVTGAH